MCRFLTGLSVQAGITEIKHINIYHNIVNL